MQAQLLASDELRNTARLTNAWFRGMYESVLGRLPTPAETSAFLAPLELNDTAAGRDAAAIQLLTSPAGTLAEIESIYTQLVPNGTPSPVDIQAIEADLASGMRLEQVAQIVSASNGNYFNYAITNHVGEVGFIGGLYQSVLGRSASGGDLQFWSTVHANGASNQQIAMFILNSPEHRASIIQGFYQTYLHRGLDPAGLNYWLSVMAMGATDEQVLGAIVGSNEYYITNGGTSDSFIRAMYRDVLHRTTPPSQPEIDYWIATLAASTRGAAQAAPTWWSASPPATNSGLRKSTAGIRRIWAGPRPRLKSTIGCCSSTWATRQRPCRHKSCLAVRACNRTVHAPTRPQSGDRVLLSARKVGSTAASPQIAR